jgi:hypothetical protein
VEAIATGAEEEIVITRNERPVVPDTIDALNEGIERLFHSAPR